MNGILAGMGPKSTGPFVDKVVDQCQKIYGAINDVDFPHMIVQRLSTLINHSTITIWKWPLLKGLADLKKQRLILSPSHVIRHISTLTKLEAKLPFPY